MRGEDAGAEDAADPPPDLVPEYPASEDPPNMDQRAITMPKTTTPINSAHQKP